MKYVLCTLAFLTLSFSTASSYAEQFSSASEYKKERELFTQAKRALAYGQFVEYKKLKKRLKDYPAVHYLEYTAIASKLRYWDRKQVKTFLEEHKGQPVADRLYARWLDYLIRGDRWQAYLEFYEGSSSAKRQCYAALANYRNGAKDAAYEQGLALWNVAHSQPETCDKLFGILIKHKKITEDIAWQRFQKAYDGRSTKLLRYMGRFFTSKDYKNAYNRAMSMRSNPALLRRYGDFGNDSELNRDVISHVIVRYANRDPIKAEREWLKVRDRLSFSNAQQARVITALVKGLVNQDKSQQADGLLSQWPMASDDLIAWRIRKALAEQDWSSVRYWIKQMPTEEQQSQRWRYWLARAETSLTKGSVLADHPAIQSLATERGYYSFIAADELQKPYAMNYEATALTPDTVNGINNNIGLIRARELHLLGETNHAIREWRDATTEFDKTQWEATGAAFHQWGWPYIAIISMTKAKSWGDIVIRFPVLHEQHYRSQANDLQLDTELLMAITRQESAFHENAVSPSDARGLMQLLPSTAKYIANKKKIQYQHSRELMQAETNIKLGSTYYRYLMDKFDDNRALSIAGYNAGPGRVNQWLRNSDGNLPVDIWIETIPFNETRRYVQNVLSFAVIYARHLGQDATLFKPEEKVAQL